MKLPGGAEWIIIGLVLLLVLGVGRIGKLGGELGTGIREFRKGLKGDDEEPAGSAVRSSGEGEEKTKS
jgi:sec-independent protein translocase protein TatA